MCEIPSNVIRIDAFAKLFDGFSIGSNDLTQLTLGVDRDSEVVAFDFDERDPAMMEMLRLAVTGARRNSRMWHLREAPANYPEIAAALVGWGIDFHERQPFQLIDALRSRRTLSTISRSECVAVAWLLSYDIPRSRQNPKILWVDDAKVVGDRIAKFWPAFGDFFGLM